MRAMWLMFSICSGSLIIYQNDSAICDNNTLVLPNITFCNIHALATKQWYYTSSGETVYGELISYYQSNTGEEFNVSKNESKYYINNVYVRELTYAVPGFLIYDPIRNTIFILGINTVTIGTLSFVEFNRNYSVLRAYDPSFQTTSIDLIFTGQIVNVLALKNNLYYVYRLTAGPLQYVSNATTTIAFFDRNTTNVTVVDRDQNIRYYCNIECNDLIVSVEFEYTSQQSSSIVEIVTHDSTVFTEETVVITSAYDTTNIQPTSQITTESQTSYFISTSNYMSTIISSNQVILSVVTWLSQDIFRVTGRPLEINGQFIIPDQSILRVDISDTDYTVGDSIILFTFSSVQGSFTELELLGISSCFDLKADLVTTDTQLSLVFVTSSVVCRASLKQIMYAGRLFVIQ